MHKCFVLFCFNSGRNSIKLSGLNTGNQVKKFILSFIILLSISLLPVAAQDVTIPQLEELVISLRLNRADILFPNKFNDYYGEFLRLRSVSEQRSLTSTEQSDLAELQRLFSELNQKAESIRPFISGVLEVRDDALFNNADDFAPSLFRQAEENLQRLADRIAEGRSENIQGFIQETIVRYREAEYEAVKNKLLSEVRILIQESRDLDAEKTVPVTYRKVDRMLKEVEKILSSQNYEDPTLGMKARELLVESRHLLNLAQLARQVQRDDSAFEQYILQLEDSIRELATLMGVTAEFSGNNEQILSDIAFAVKELKRELDQQKKQNVVLLDSLEDLQQEIAALRSQVMENETTLHKVDQLKSRLASENIKVLYQNDRIVLRMNGIEFPLGKIQINRTDRERLEKIGEVLRNFPDKRIRVQLGQSAAGNSQYSKALADQRARSVALIIQSAGYIPDTRISSEGILLEQPGTSTAHAIVDVIVEL